MDSDQFKTQFASKLQTGSGLPYLFVGSGLSRRYLGTEDWDSLLDKYAREMGKTVRRYQANTTLETGENPLLLLPKTGSLIAADFVDHWFSDTKYTDQTKLFESISGRQDRPLKIAISEYLKSKTLEYSEGDSDLQTELQLLRQARVRGIITTNYDTLLEQIFPDFTAFVGQNDLITSQITLVHDIYKIHGSVTDPTSLILVYDDYKRFMEINKYLVAKLLTIFVENPIIFLGYSVSDLNIQEILSDIMRISTDQNFIRSKIQDKIFIVEWHPEITSPEIATIHKSIMDIQIPMTLIKIPNFIDLFQVLTELPEVVPQAVLKYVLQNLYEVKEASDGIESRKTVVLLDRESYSNDNIHNLEIVIGFGIQEKISRMGLTGLGTKDILDDILTDSLMKKKFNPDDILTEGIEIQFTPEVHKYIPLCKYLNLSGRFSGTDIFAGIPKTKKIFAKAYALPGISGFYSHAPSKARRDDVIKYSSFDEFIYNRKIDNEFFHDLAAIAEVKGIDFIDGGKLQAALLLDNPTDETTRLNASYTSNLICMVDKLLYFPWSNETKIIDSFK